MTTITKTTDHLTGHELYRLLHRGDLDAEVARVIWENDYEEACYLAEIAAEQRAEGRRSRCYQTRLERYMAANPLHTCTPPPTAGWGQEWHEGDDIPF